MSNHSTLSKCLLAPAWMASLDLKDAYLHVPIRRNLHKFLALTCWGKLFFFRSLPFGLATARWLFSLLMEQALAELRNKGINILGYIDDLVLWNQNKQLLEEHVERTVSFLVGLGLTLNWEKSCPSPASSLIWVGVDWDGLKGLWSPQQKLLERIQSQARRLTTQELGTRRQWESFLGLEAFAAQLNQRAKHWSHPVSQIGLFDHTVDQGRS